METVTRDWAALAANPIRPEKPCGGSVLYDSSYEMIKMEMAGIEALPPKRPEWKLILGKSAEILEAKSKDLTVAAFLTLALFQEHGYSGLAQGLDVCRILVVRYWDDLFPEIRRMRGREAAFSWLNDRMHIAISRKPPTAQEAEAVQACLTAFGFLDGIVSERFGPYGPSLGDLHWALKEAAVSEETRALLNSERLSPERGTTDTSEAFSRRVPPASDGRGSGD